LRGEHNDQPKGEKVVAPDMVEDMMNARKGPTDPTEKKKKKRHHKKVVEQDSEEAVQESQEMPADSEEASAYIEDSESMKNGK